MHPLGFILLTHNKPHQTLRLVRRVSAMYAERPIVIHHEFGKSDRNAARFPANVRFVRPHVRAERGRMRWRRATASRGSSTWTRMPTHWTRWTPCCAVQVFS
jgi:hypothetical protein